MTMFRYVYVLEAVSLRISCEECGPHYEVPRIDVLLSSQMLKECCPVYAESERPSLFQTRLMGSGVLRELAIAWNQMETASGGTTSKR